MFPQGDTGPSHQVSSHRCGLFSVNFQKQQAKVSTEPHKQLPTRLKDGYQKIDPRLSFLLLFEVYKCLVCVTRYISTIFVDTNNLFICFRCVRMRVSVPVQWSAPEPFPAVSKAACVQMKYL